MDQLSFLLGDALNDGDDKRSSNFAGLSSLLGMGDLNALERLGDEEEEEQTTQTVIEERPSIEKEKKEEEEEEDLFPPHTILVPQQNEEGHILRFSELFGPRRNKYIYTNPYVKKLQRRKRKHFLSNQVDRHQYIEKQKEFKIEEEIELESNEETEFLQLKKEIDVSKIQPTKREEKQEEYDSREEPKRMKEPEVDTKILQRINIEPVDQIRWEDEIIWEEDPSKNKIKLVTNEEEKSKDGKKPVYEGMNHGPLWGTLKEDLPQKTSSTPAPPQNQGTTPSTSAPPKTLNGVPNQVNMNTISPINKNGQPIPMQPISAIFGQTQKLPIPSSPLRGTPPGMHGIPTMNGMPSGIQPRSIIPKPVVQPPIPQPNPLIHPPPVPISTTDLSDKKLKKKQARRKYTRRKKLDSKEDDIVPQQIDQLSDKDVVQIETSRQEDRVLGDQVLNYDLLEGDWLEYVLWDEEDSKKKKGYTKLILNLNDKHMIFNEDGEKPEKREEPQLSATDILIRRKTKFYFTNMNVDKKNIYNLSNDHNYDEIQTLQGHQRKGRQIVQHSRPAIKLDKNFFRTSIDKEELRNLHRMPYEFPIQEPILIQHRPPKKPKSRKKHKTIEKKSELSAHDHRLILLEYIEEKPPVLNNVGMGTKINNYYKKPQDDMAKIPKCIDGDRILVESQESLPLIAPLKDGKFTTSTENSMFSAQIFPHKVPETDFLLCTRQGSDGSLRLYIREIPIYYTVGHTQPHIEVPSPNSRSAINFMKNRLNLFIYRRFKSQQRREDMKIKIEEIKEAFPDLSETSIRKRLKECADFQRGGGDSGWWVAKPDLRIPGEEELLGLVTPEMVCLNESMMAGDLRLNDVGINADASMAGFAVSFARLEGEREYMRDVIRFIEQERMNTPWNKTLNAINAIEGKEGAKLHLLSVANQNLSKEKLDEYDRIIEAVGKDSDKSSQIQISHEEAKKILMEKGGYTEDRIKGMTRADRKQTARRILETHGGKKNSAKDVARQNKFREILHAIFSEEAKKLEEGIEYYSKEDTKDQKDILGIEENLEKEEKEEEDDMDDIDMEEYERDLESALEVEEDSYMSELQEEQELKNLFGSDEMFDEDGSDSDARSVTSVSTTTTTTVKKPRRRKIVKKTYTITLEDGTRETKTEIIRDPQMVEFYIRKKQEIESGIKRKKNKLKNLFGDVETDSFQTGNKEKRKLQDQFRRWKKQKEEQKLGVFNIPKKRTQAPKKKRAMKKTNIKCGACGETGHMSTNKSCPMYDKNKSEHVKVDEKKKTKLKINTAGITQDKESLKIRIPTDIAQMAEKKSMYTDYLAPRPQMKRRRKTYADEIAQVLNKVCERLKQHPSAPPFLYPVDPKQFPDYRKIITKPMDLSQIHKKINNLEYLDEVAFMKDIELMVNNARTYCHDKFPHILPLADDIQKYANEVMAQHIKRIQEIKEQEEKDKFFYPPKKKKKKKVEENVNKQNGETL